MAHPYCCFSLVTGLSCCVLVAVDFYCLVISSVFLCLLVPCFGLTFFCHINLAMVHLCVTATSHFVGAQLGCA